jgi:hypothetical protein
MAVNNGTPDIIRAPKSMVWSEALLWALADVMLFVLMVAVYRMGYDDGARQAAPLAAPPTKAERAR